MSSELWEFLAVNTKHLVSELYGVFFDHFLYSPLLQHSSVHRHCIEAFEGQSQDAGLSVLDPCLAIGMVSDEFFEFSLLFQVVILSLLDKHTL